MNDIKARAEALLAGRMQYVEELSQRSIEASELRERLAQAEAAESSAWTAAVGAGWTPKELTGELGFTQPASRRGGRSKRAVHGPRRASQAQETTR